MKCKVCKGKLKFAKGIGWFCPKKGCPELIEGPSKEERLLNKDAYDLRDRTYLITFCRDFGTLAECEMVLGCTEKEFYELYGRYKFHSQPKDSLRRESK